VSPSRANVIAVRNTISVLGDGFVEAIDSNTLLAIVNASRWRSVVSSSAFPCWSSRDRAGPAASGTRPAGEPALVRRGRLRERDGHHEPDADRRAHGKRRRGDRSGPGNDDEGVDVALFALFMRSTKAPPVDTAIANSADGQRGSQLFDAVGCAVCHTRTIVTAPAGTTINGGALKVANALGNKIIHPFSDYALHDLGTGDGIVQNGGPTTRNKIRTPALWGLRARGRFMHDNVSLSFEDAIARHGNQGAAARDAFNRLSSTDRRKLLTFLSLCSRLHNDSSGSQPEPRMTARPVI
jgi:mono/diheme cytochrome c family protein